MNMLPKNELRKMLLENRNKLSKEERSEKSNCIVEKLMAEEYYKKAECIFTYLSMGSEVETTALIEKCWKQRKCVCVPVAVRGSRKMYFVKIDSFEKMKRSKIGVLEPEIGLEKEVIPRQGELFIVPGSAFDCYGNRFGYGGGYYDTYFEANTDVLKIALCYDFQLLDEVLPVEKHDRKMNYIITENRAIKSF